MVPGVYGVYSAIKNKRIQSNLERAIEEIKIRSDRLEAQMTTLRQKEKFGGFIVEYLEAVADDPELEKIKFYVESLVTGIESDYLIMQKKSIFNYSEKYYS